MSQPSTQANRIITLNLEPNEPRRLANLCGQRDEHLKLIESRLGVTLRNRGNMFQLAGPGPRVKAASNLVEHLYRETASTELTPDSVHLFLQESGIEALEEETEEEIGDGEVLIRTPRTLIKPRGLNQQGYVTSIRQHDINFGIGPAGTGKTYLAVAAAVEALNQQQVRRILLVRPAVEAGEKLGFLPGDLAQKIDPYLRPLYDALYEMIGFEQVAKLIERQVIEIAPLAYMRGRTLNNAFIILDESQNTTREQMKMFLTRIGFGSTAVITGDVTQVDLPRGQSSGLIQVLDVLKDTAGIGVTHFAAKDVVRHPMVQRIIEAYDLFEANQEAEERARREARAEERRQERADRLQFSNGSNGDAH
ncbi:MULTISPECIES: PhoH family protein [Halomonas]|uniref:PhoH family protein n=1 Tax=Halomonas TaxID=2745 RepID=UPI001C96CC19|nr:MULTISPECIES: PhoH family protein [Halomonas]MEE3215983.1 PhoH family protein [Pseudomonadota bacterium]MBY5924094.1 PhoH family protein [Halomonas sp. DP4Y7-2]MBY5928261.1 PhoH family protein [Halomonas sp. DP8Y7-3]MBY5967204.1 PhoH family protein [Halomonas denitrificans]MBY6208701.1 PhoH family protein [Halomonas sp. DP3Y7-2]